MRTFSTKAYYLIRLYMKKLCQLSKDDMETLYLLEAEEVSSYLKDGGPKWGEILEQRRATYFGFRAFVPPDDFGGKGQIDVPVLTGPLLQGAGCSPGIATGRAVILTSPQQSHLILPGDILVTRFTDPGWTPLLGRVVAVVTEVGGVLSHAAVIGREYGIPAVLNVNSATQKIRTGMIITVDGDQGLVMLKEEDVNDGI